MKTRGKLIVFEGQDAVGKSRLSQEIARWLETLEIPTVQLSFPGKSPRTLGKLVYELHHSPRRLNVNSITPAALQAMHIAAHLDIIETEIIPKIESGIYVILDRFWWSTYVYGKVYHVKEDILGKMIDTELAMLKKISPAAVFLITRTPAFIGNRNSELNKLATEYLKLAEEEIKKYKVFIINNDGHIDLTINKIQDKLQRILKIN
jgi:dTMP kinase